MAQRKSHRGEKETAPGWARVPVGSHLEANPIDQGGRRRGSSSGTGNLQSTGQMKVRLVSTAVAFLMHPGSNGGVKTSLH